MCGAVLHLRSGTPSAQTGSKFKYDDSNKHSLREGLPLRRDDWAEYLGWAVEAFRVASACVRDETQSHTHMCDYEVNNIIQSIAALDADVISIETSRSQMELLGAFGKFRYPNEIGPGVYDIHSPRVPTREDIELLLGKALAVLAPNSCG